MNKTILAILIVQVSTLPLLAQNLLNYDGGFSAVVSNKLYNPQNTTPDQYDLWKTATNYTSSEGEGWVDINQSLDTVINIENDVSGNRDGNNNHLGIIDAQIDTTILTINNFGNRTISQTHAEGSAIHIRGNATSEVVLNGGTYEKTSVQSKEAETGIFTSLGSLTLNGTSFYGANNDGNNNIDGGAALLLTGGNTTINFDEDVGNNILQGGNDLAAFYSQNLFDGQILNLAEATGGAAIKAAGGGNVTATNLYAQAGTSGGFTFESPVFAGATVAIPWGGGHGIEGSFMALNMYKGWIRATDSGGITVQSAEQNHSWTGTFTTHGGSAVEAGIGTGTIYGATLIAGNGGPITLNADVTGLATLDTTGGFGINGSSAGSTIMDSEIYAGNAGNIDEFSAWNMNAALVGGTAFNNIGNSSTVMGSRLIGGNGGIIIATTTDTNLSSVVSANAGNGFTGVLLSSNSVFKGGNGGSIFLSGETVTATANGGDGASIAGTSIIQGGTFSGGTGGTANINKGAASAAGGAGISQTSGTLTINDGDFTGGNGGTAFGDTADARGGHGVFVSGGVLNINGGTFRPGNAGSVLKKSANTVKGRGLAALNSSVTLDGESVFTEGMLFEVTTGTESLNLLQGTINGDVEINMSAGATTDMTVRESMQLGLVQQTGGQLNVNLSYSEEAHALLETTITDGTMTYDSYASIRGQHTLLSENSTLAFAEGAVIDRAVINAGLGRVEATIGDLLIGGASVVNLSFATLFETNGVSRLEGGQINMGTGDLVLMTPGSRITASGIAANPNDTVTLATIGTGSVLASTNIEQFVDADFGWLVDTMVTNVGDIQVNLSYKPLNDTSLANINSNILASVDAMFTSNSTSEAEFYGVNAAGAQSLRFVLTQLPEVSETAFKVSNEVNKQIAARGTEHRSMNGFASSKPNFSNGPIGVAGPTTGGEQEKTMKGWIRGYASKGDADLNGDFSGYNSATWGSVIGIDKSFGNVLVGIAGGMARTDLDGAYEADVDTYHGSVYSTIGGERIFVDLALTYGQSKTEENGVNETNFDSDMLSFYLGAGMAFEVKEKFSLTPEASITATHYEQDGFTRNGVWGTGVAKAYDTTSYLGSIGVNISSLHQMDWLNRRLAFIPELRLHWLHEFDNDPDDFQYNVNSVGFMPFAVRPRDENTARIGVGFDMWSWKHQSTKFEVDYDGLFSDTYTEHIVSGKLTIKF